MGLSTASDQDVLAAAEQAGAVLLSADTDFGELLSHSNADRPSVILRRQEGRRASEIAALIVANSPPSPTASAPVRSS